MRSATGGRVVGSNQQATEKPPFLISLGVSCFFGLEPQSILTSYKWFLWFAATVHFLVLLCIFPSSFPLHPPVACLSCWSRGDLPASELYRLAGNSEDDAVRYQHPVLLWGIPSTSGTLPRASLSLTELWAAITYLGVCSSVSQGWQAHLPDTFPVSIGRGWSGGQL